MNTAVPQELSLQQTASDALIFNTLLGSLIVGTMKINPAIWANDYPPDIKEKFGAVDTKTKRQSIIVAIPFFLLTGGGLIWSNIKLKRHNQGRLSFQAAFLNAYALILSGWFFDLTILDWFMFVRHTPDFVVLPGTEGMAGYDDYGFHLREHLRALPMLAGFALIVAMLTASRPWRNKHT